MLIRMLLQLLEVFYYQYLIVLKKWIHNYLNEINVEAFTEVVSIYYFFLGIFSLFFRLVINQIYTDFHNDMLVQITTLEDCNTTSHIII